MGINPNQYFLLDDGTSIKNLNELADSLDTMPKKIFQHHVSDERNDFANWVRDAVKDKELAAKLESVKTSATMSKYIKERIRSRSKRQKVQKKKSDKAEIPHKEKDIMKKMQEIMNNKQEKQQTKQPDRISMRQECPYKSFRCSFLEFLFGIAVGLAIGLILAGVLR